MTRDQHIGDGMDGVRENLRRLIVVLKAQGKIRHVNDWCKRAGMTNSGRIVDFLAGKIRSPNLATLMALAAVVDLPVSVLIGDAVARDDVQRLVTDWLAQAPEPERRRFMADLLRAAAEEETAPAAPPPDPHADWREPPGPPPAAPGRRQRRKAP